MIHRCQRLTTNSFSRFLGPVTNLQVRADNANSLIFEVPLYAYMALSLLSLGYAAIRLKGCSGQSREYTLLGRQSQSSPSLDVGAVLRRQSCRNH